MSTKRRTQSATKASEKVARKGTPTQPAKQTRSASGSLLWFALVVAIGSAIYYFGAGLARIQAEDETRSDLTPEEQRDASIFTVQDIPGKGMGVIAVRDIEQGELIIRERPLFIVPSQINSSPTALISRNLRALTYPDYEAFFNLSYVNFPAELDPEEHPDEVALAIFQTNAVAADSGVGIFPRMARLNHGCSSAFNVVYTWREREGALAIHALKPIKKGQELLTVYVDTKRPRHQRREYLSQSYGFHCTCDVCSLPDQESRISDQRLIAITELYERFGSWGTRDISGPEAIDIARRIWDLGSQEGYWSERGTLAADAATVAAAHSDATATREWAELAIRWYTYELGGDSEQVGAMGDVVTDPQRHKFWGSRERLDVGGPGEKIGAV